MTFLVFSKYFFATGFVYTLISTEKSSGYLVTILTLFILETKSNISCPTAVNTYALLYTFTLLKEICTQENHEQRKSS